MTLKTQEDKFADLNGVHYREVPLYMQTDVYNVTLMHMYSWIFYLIWIKFS